MVSEIENKGVNGNGITMLQKLDVNPLKRIKSYLFEAILIDPLITSTVLALQLYNYRS